VPGTSNLLYPKLPATDLGRLTIKDQGNYLMAMLTPIIKNPIELDQNYSFFLRRKIDELVDEKGPNGETVETAQARAARGARRLKRARSGPRKEIAKALRLKPYTDKKTSKKVIGWPAKVDYVWRSTPATNVREQAGSQIPNYARPVPGRRRSGISRA
jgi:hypothetical protein